MKYKDICHGTYIYDLHFNYIKQFKQDLGVEGAGPSGLGTNVATPSSAM